MLYAVTKPVGTTNSEFEAYISLLTELGVDTASLVRVREKNTDRKWLYAWPDIQEAEDFAAQLRLRTQDTSWNVVGFEPDLATENTPGLQVNVSPVSNGFEYKLTGDSFRSILTRHPAAKPTDRIFVPAEVLTQFEESHGTFENQARIVLTGLNQQQISDLGGVRFVYGSGISDSSVLLEVQPPLQFNEQTKVSQVLDRLLANGASSRQIINQLHAWTVGDEHEDSRLRINPYRGDLESQYWFWNRAASGFLSLNRYSDALEVFASHYLAILGIQSRIMARLHKGMPLCNIGYALQKLGNSQLACTSWFLGFIEDAMSRPGTAMQAANFKNLVSTGVSTLFLDTARSNIDRIRREIEVIPILPEAIVFASVSRIRDFPDARAVDALQSLVGSVANAYPKPLGGNAWEALRTTWATFNLRLPTEVAS